MPDEESGDRTVTDIKAAFNRGKSSGSEVVAARNLHARSVRSAAQGLLVAEGDSWFDHPGGDVLSALEDLGFDVEANAHCGDTLEDMSFNPRQLGDLHRLLTRVKLSGRSPKALLLCGGENDIAGEEFAVLLNHATSGLPALNAAVVEGVIDGRLKVALSHWIGSVDAVARGVFGLPLKIVIHGYDYPVPDGRGSTLGPSRPKGPWLRPGFWLKGHTNLQRNRGVLRDLINRLNDMQVSLVEELELPNLVHVDLRNTLSSVLYENDWDNELQPTEAGFRSLARKLAAAL
ncbi:MAG: hypothetical protein ABI565_14225 [Vicinamibacteria bacterium]